MILHGKVYFTMANSYSNALNETDVEERDGGIFPLKESGQRVEDEIDADRIAAILIRRFPPDQFYVAMAVWDDSFVAFQKMRTSIEKLGYSYRTLPADNSAVFQFSKGRRSLVQ